MNRAYYSNDSPYDSDDTDTYPSPPFKWLYSLPNDRTTFHDYNSAMPTRSPSLHYHDSENDTANELIEVIAKLRQMGQTETYLSENLEVAKARMEMQENQKAMAEQLVSSLQAGKQQHKKDTDHIRHLENLLADKGLDSFKLKDVRRFYEEKPIGKTVAVGPDSYMWSESPLHAPPTRLPTFDNIDRKHLRDLEDRNMALEKKLRAFEWDTQPTKLTFHEGVQVNLDSSTRDPVSPEHRAYRRTTEDTAHTRELERQNRALDSQLHD
eukprot:Platyproteum_vivax@DN16025_c0_g1_i1.p1